jgi:hypothetical protein
MPLSSGECMGCGPWQDQGRVVFASPRLRLRLRLRLSRYSKMQVRQLPSHMAGSYLAPPVKSAQSQPSRKVRRSAQLTTIRCYPLDRYHC